MVRSTSGKTARSRGRSLLRTDRKDIHWLGHLGRRWCKPVDREAVRSHLFHQDSGARPYFNQARSITHVPPVTPSGTTPTSRFSPDHGRATTYCSPEHLAKSNPGKAVSKRVHIERDKQSTAAEQGNRREKDSRKNIAAPAGIRRKTQINHASHIANSKKRPK